LRYNPAVKSTVEEIRRRFDNDVERFSNLETGQAAMMDSRLMLDLAAGTAAALHPPARRLLDIGCGAGNYTLALMRVLPSIEEVTLIDLSRPMLDRARERIGAARAVRIDARQCDIRGAELAASHYDVAVAAGVFHHLREEVEWRETFAKVARSLTPGGSLWIVDMIEHTHPAIQAAQWKRYGEYLTGLRDEAYRDHVFAYIEKEDTPRPLVWQLDLLRECGFGTAEVLHKQGPFALYGGVKNG
jgi:tRNA (cmo5U34)-methyltransferase